MSRLQPYACAARSSRIGHSARLSPWQELTSCSSVWRIDSIWAILRLSSSICCFASARTSLLARVAELYAGLKQEAA